MGLDWSALSETGRVRPVNEDAFIHRDFGTLRVWAVADGMGGHRAGEVASRLALEAVADALALVARQVEAGGRLSGRELKGAVLAAHRSVAEQSSQRPDLAGMGTTLTAAAIVRRTVLVGHVGDSRAYLFRGNLLEQLTTDHSVVEELRSAGLISRDEAMNHPHRNILTRALGLPGPIRVDIVKRVVRRGDILILCSDGLSGYVPPEAIARTAASGLDAEALAVELGRLADGAGGQDNTTIVAVKIGPSGRRSRA